MRLAGRPGLWFCDVTPAVPLSDLVLSFRAADRSPVLAAFLQTIRNQCSDVGSALDRHLALRSSRLDDDGVVTATR
jgi:hypothetical protein